ncbi:flap endonuclease 1 [Mrakia frigida]|uniref:flap endonuclease 1 n=1 Tax=Mrakia frigida TaxID=29902 RepID=UPI003FCC0FE1
MGIKGLTDLIRKNAPQAITELSPKSLAGKRVAIDASMSMYQFLIAIRLNGGSLQTNTGEGTSHLSGLFYRTTRIAGSGIKAAYVFDGQPPELKKELLEKRSEGREKASAKEEEADGEEEIEKYSKRQLKVTKEMNEEAKELLKLMGIPVVEAPGEAEAQCAELARGGKVDAVASEDLDTLTFNSPLLLRNLTGTDAQAKKITQLHLGDVLSGLDLNMDQFVDLSILLGCDYLPPLHGVGPVGALKMLRQHGTLDAVLADLRKKQAQREREAAEGKKKPSAGLGKIEVPEGWRWEAAKEVFLRPEVAKAKDVKLIWKAPDRQGLKDFMVQKYQFDPKRIESATDKLQRAYEKY